METTRLLTKDNGDNKTAYERKQRQQDSLQRITETTGLLTKDNGDKTAYRG